MKTIQVILTDGGDVFEVRQLPRDTFAADLAELNRRTTEVTDGNMLWCEDRRGYQGSSYSLSNLNK